MASDNLLFSPGNIRVFIGGVKIVMVNFSTNFRTKRTWHWIFRKLQKWDLAMRREGKKTMKWKLSKGDV